MKSVREILGGKKIFSLGRVELYQCLDPDWILVVSGVGKVATSSALAIAAERFPQARDSFFNFGIAGSFRRDRNRFQAYRIRKITDAGTGRDFFPDFICSSPWENAEVLCSDFPIIRSIAEEEPGFDLVDMESSGFFQTASLYCSLDRIHSVKWVSDYLEGGKLDKEKIERQLQSQAGEFLEWVGKVSERAYPSGKKYAHNTAKDRPVSGKSPPIQLLEEMAGWAIAEFRLSQTQSIRCREEMEKWVLRGFPEYSVEDLQNRFASIRNQLAYQAGESRTKEKGKEKLSKLFGMLRADQSGGFNVSGETKRFEEAKATEEGLRKLPAYKMVYCEKEVLSHPRTQKILQKLGSPEIIQIRDYKDVFNRPNQSFQIQKSSPKIILASKKDKFLYPGSDLAPDFGNKNFFYNALMLNCPFNCDYCYLQGMYRSGNIVLFVNLEEYFQETEKYLERLKEIYLCLSYDTDLLGLEGIAGYCKEWIKFAGDKPNLLLEIRTKSGNFEALKSVNPIPNCILAWTLSPQDLVHEFEKKTASLKARLAAIRKALDAGWSVRVCIDPILVLPNWESLYAELFNQLQEYKILNRVTEISVGSFRMNADFFGKVRKIQKTSRIFDSEFERVQGRVQYSSESIGKILDFIRDHFEQYSERFDFPVQIEEGRIYSAVDI
jgi:spore photoproduct lyase